MAQLVIVEQPKQGPKQSHKQTNVHKNYGQKNIKLINAPVQSWKRNKSLTETLPCCSDNNIGTKRGKKQTQPYLHQLEPTINIKYFF